MPSTPSILLVTTSFPQGTPGAEAAGSFVADFASTLSRHHPVTVIAPALTTSSESIHNLTIHRFAVPRLPLSLLKPTQPGHWPALYQTLRAGSRATLLHARHASHILALWALPSGDWARKAAKEYHLPYSVWVLGSDIWSLSRIPLVRQRLAHVLQQAQTRFADGLVLAEDVQRIAQCPCQFLPSSRILPRKERSLRANPPYRLAFLGRFHPNKGIDLLLQALEILPEEGWENVEEIRIAGGGPLEQHVAEQVEGLKKKGRPVRLLGYLDKEQASDLLHFADWLLIPSRIESIPVVFSDALQAGTPVVSMPTGDLTRLAGEVGILAREITAPAFAQAMLQALVASPAALAPSLSRMERGFSVQGAVDRFLSGIAPGGITSPD